MHDSPIQLGFAGLGQMGKHMARNLLGPDVALTVCNRSAGMFSGFEKAGARTTTDPADMAACDIVFLCLPGDEAVKTMLLGQGGLVPLMRTGSVIVDCGTTGVAATRDIAAVCAARGVEFIDAPVSGMEARAKDGTLTIMAGGDPAVLDAVMPYLRRMGGTILHMGGSGAGQAAKLINQLLFDVNMAALAEVLPLAVKLGLDPEKTGEIINSGTGRSYASEFFIPRILENTFSDGYPLENAYKDIVSGFLVSAVERVALPVVQAASATYQAALCMGYGKEDKGAMIKVHEALLNVKFRKKT